MPKPWNSFSALKRDCRWFKGDIPCVPHKRFGVHCVDEQGQACTYYDPLTANILIIKLGAIGDVLRTTPLLRRLKELHSQARIWWLTHTPDILPRVVDVGLAFTPQSVAILHAVQFDIVYNLDKDREACALLASIDARIKKGYTLQDGVPAPLDEGAVPKYLTGVFDDLSKENTRSYPQEIFDIVGLEFRGERYILESYGDRGYTWKLPKSKRVIGLNTGCGGRWVSRLWAEKNWVALAKRLKQAGYLPLLLGGSQEDEKNKRIARKSGARYLGHFPLQQFINLVDQCDLVVTAVTMALHIAVGLNKKIILFNNIFNRHEFELYGLGEILEPAFDCTCYYSPVCPNDCMQYITVDRVFKTCTQLLPV